jgi:hypothetical protein
MLFDNTTGMTHLKNASQHYTSDTGAKGHKHFATHIDVILVQVCDVCQLHNGYCNSVLNASVM